MADSSYEKGLTELSKMKASTVNRLVYAVMFVTSVIT